MTAATVLVCVAIGYCVGTLAAIPYRPSPTETKVNRDGKTVRTETRYVHHSEYAESNAVRMRVTLFCALAGLLAAQSVFIVTHLRPASLETR